MSLAPESTTAEFTEPPVAPLDAEPPRRQRRRALVTALVVVVVAAGVAVAVADPFGSTTTSKAGGIDNADPTSLATVSQQALSSETQVDATLGYAGIYSVVNQAQGTVTALPPVGQVVSQGQVLYQVSGSPVVLLYGSTPAYRSLSEGASASDVTGPDVEELNADLVALGYVTSAELSPTSDEFGYWTKVGVEALQAALGETQNGTLTLGQAVVRALGSPDHHGRSHPRRAGSARPTGADGDLHDPRGDHRPRCRPAVRGEGG